MNQIDEIQELCLKYLKTCMHGNGFAKGTAHFEICKFLCCYITNEPSYRQQHGSLKLRIHEITSEITDRIEDIGFPVPRGYVEPTILEEDMPRYATKLAFRIIRLIDQQNKDELLKLVW